MNTAMVANIISSAFAIAAAVLWLRSALVKTPKEFPLRAVQYDEYVENPVTGAIPEHSPGTVQSKALAELAIALQRQSKLSAWAAVCACVAAVAQTVALW